MKVPVKITIDKELVEKAKKLNLNISDFVSTALGTYLSVPDKIIQQYVALNRTQKGKVARKLKRISKEMFGDVVKTDSNISEDEKH